MCQDIVPLRTLASCGVSWSDRAASSAPSAPHCVGGNISLYTELCEKARADAFQLMLQQAAASGANAVIGVRYDANEVTAGVTEVLAYGTAVVVERITNH